MLENKEIEMEQPQELISNMREVASEDDKPVRAIGKQKLIDKFEEIQKLRELRNEQIESKEGDLETVKELNNRLDNIRKELARNRIPYHPIIGCKGDYKHFREEFEAKIRNEKGESLDTYI